MRDVRLSRRNVTICMLYCAKSGTVGCKMEWKDMSSVKNAINYCLSYRRDNCLYLLL